jgi:HEAT repeat protein
MIYWLEEGPRLSLAAVTPDGFEIVSSFEPEVGGKEVWIHPVIARGRLFVRSDCAQGGDYARAAGKLAVYDLRAGHETELRAQRERIRQLIAALKSKAASARAAAARELREMGWKARPAVTALADALTDPDGGVRKSAAAALAAIGPEAAPALIRSLENERVWTESLAADALVKATPGADDLTDALIDAAEADVTLRKNVAAILGRVGASAAPDLDKLLRSSDRRLRWWAIDVLAGYGPGAKAAAANLTHVVRTGDQWFRAKAARALGQIGPGAARALPALLELLKHDFADARAAAAEALGRIGRKDEKVIAALRAASKDKDAKAAAAAVEALKKLQP